jgi:iron complex transport system permease protein
MRPHAGVAGRLPPALAVGGGVVLALLALLWGGAQGAYAISPLQIMAVLRDALGGHAAQGPEHLVFLNIRLPRLLLGAAAGAGLGVAYFAPILFEDVIKKIESEGGQIGFQNGNGPTM